MFLPCLHSKKIPCVSPSLDQEILQFSSHFQLKDIFDFQVLPSQILLHKSSNIHPILNYPRSPLRFELGIRDQKWQSCLRLLVPSLHLLGSWLLRNQGGDLGGVERDGGRRKKQCLFCRRALVIHISVSSLMVNLQMLADTGASLPGWLLTLHFSQSEKHFRLLPLACPSGWGPSICFELYLLSNPFCVKERKLVSLNKLCVVCSPLLPFRLALPSNQFKHFPSRTPQVRGRDQSPCLYRSQGYVRFSL